MTTYKRIIITLHLIELKKLNKIAKQHNETRSGMISRIIQNYTIQSDNDWIGEKTEMSYYAP